MKLDSSLSKKNNILIEFTNYLKNQFVKGCYNKLVDKSLNLKDRLKLAESLWHATDLSSAQSNKQQLIIDWIIDLIVNKRKYITYYIMSCLAIT